MRTTVFIKIPIETEDYYGDFIPTPRQIARLVSEKISAANADLTSYIIEIEGCSYPVEQGILLEGVYGAVV